MFSIVIPIDSPRLEQFHHTKLAYDEMPEKKEFILVTRSFDSIVAYLEKYELSRDVRVIPYSWERGFNCSKALNIGIRHATFEQVIITSPEVKPHPNTLGKLRELVGKNVVCQVFDEAENGNLSVLVAKGFRDSTPAMYFLAMFNKSDIEKINGWDEEFMKGYAYEDDDFGARWVRAGLPFEVHDEIQATHQYHPRSETIMGGMATNQQHYHDNTDNGVTYCDNGLKVI